LAVVLETVVGLGAVKNPAPDLLETAFAPNAGTAALMLWVSAAWI